MRSASFGTAVVGAVLVALSGPNAMAEPVVGHTLQTAAGATKIQACSKRTGACQVGEIPESAYNVYLGLKGNIFAYRQNKDGRLFQAGRPQQEPDGGTGIWTIKGNTVLVTLRQSIGIIQRSFTLRGGRCSQAYQVKMADEDVVVTVLEMAPCSFIAGHVER